MEHTNTIERENKIWWDAYNAAITGVALGMIEKNWSAHALDVEAASVADKALDRYRKQTEPLQE